MFCTEQIIAKKQIEIYCTYNAQAPAPIVKKALQNK